MRVRDAMFTHRAEQHSHKLSMPSAPNDKKVCSPGGFCQCRGWMALSDLGLNRDAWVRLPHRVDRFGQHFSGVGTCPSQGRMAPRSSSTGTMLAYRATS